MSQENVEIVRAAFEAFEDGDMEAVLRLADENIEITQPAELLGASPTQSGHAGVLEAFAVWPELWDDYHIEIVRLADVGDHVIAATVTRGRGKDSGVPVEMPFTFVFSVRAGKIAEWRLFVREDQALKAVGLEE
jgi:ketosteroid isomerase-like protein